MVASEFKRLRELGLDSGKLMVAQGRVLRHCGKSFEGLSTDT